MNVTFLTRAGCHLCAAAEGPVRAAAHHRGATLEVIDVDDGGLAAEFGDRVPVVLLDGAEVLSGRFTIAEVEKALPPG